jgi:hypothetical protein
MKPMIKYLQIKIKLISKNVYLGRYLFIYLFILNEQTYLFNYYITFLIYNAKISDNNAKSGKVPRMLAAFPR